MRVGQSHGNYFGGRMKHRGRPKGSPNASCTFTISMSSSQAALFGSVGRYWTSICPDLYPFILRGVWRGWMSGSTEVCGASPHIRLLCLYQVGLRSPTAHQVPSACHQNWPGPLIHAWISPKEVVRGVSLVPPKLASGSVHPSSSPHLPPLINISKSCS